MNRSALLINVLLGIAIAVLYFLHFHSAPSIPVIDNSSHKTDSLVKTMNTTQVQKESKIVYLNIDTLFVKYEYYKKVSDEANATLKSYESGYEKRVADFQQKYQDYVDKAGAGLIPKEQAMKIEEDLQGEKNKILEMEANRTAIQDAASAKLTVVQKKLYDFFKAFSKQNNYSCILTYTVKGEGALGIDDDLDVTDLIIKGLNDEYHELLKNQPKKK